MAGDMRVPAIHVTVTSERRGDSPLVVHRTRRIGGADVTVRRGIPVTTGRPHADRLR